MSTACVSSQFSDFSDVMFQNQTNSNRGQLDLTKVLNILSSNPEALQAAGPLLSSLSRSRNSSGSSDSSSNGSGGSSSMGSPGSTGLNHFPAGSTAAQLISLLTPEPQSPTQPSLTNVPHRKLDRSMSEPASMLTDRNNNSIAAQAAKSVNSSRYKTELCRPFEENGFCKYGDKCQFAHGEPELRNLNRHPKYKTERCRTFHSTGFCPYGPRCHFIHNEDERKLTHISHLKSQQQQQIQVVQQLLAQAQQQSPRSPPVSTQAQPRPINGAAKALNFSLSLPPMVRDTLGSTADSPPSSLRGSPTLSPMYDDLVSSAGSTLSGISMFSAPSPPPQSAPPGFHAGPSAFPFAQPASPPSSFGLMTPPRMSPMSDATIASLAAEMQATSLNSVPASPTHSLDESVECGSPKAVRLPIFNNLMSDQ